MAGIRMNVDVKGAATFFKNALKTDYLPALDDVGEYLKSETDRRFVAGKTWEGKDIIESDRVIDKGGVTLVEFGNLMQSYIYSPFADGLGLEFGSTDVRAAIHHFGGKTGRKYATTLPARPVMGINADDDAEIFNIFSDFTDGQLQRAGA